MLVRWNPFNSRSAATAISPVLSEFDALFRDLGFRDVAGAFGGQWSTFTPAADIVETDGQIQVKVDLPGHSPENIQVELEGDTLTIKSERKTEKQEKGQNYLHTERSYGVYSRSFVLPSSVDGSKPEAQYANGVLTVTLPKREEAKSKVIPVKAS